MYGQKRCLEERSFLAFREDLSKDLKPTAPEPLSIVQNQAPNPSSISQGGQESSLCSQLLGSHGPRNPLQEEVAGTEE